MTLFSRVMQGQVNRLLFVDAAWESVDVSNLNASADDDSTGTGRFYFKHSGSSRELVTNFKPGSYMALKIGSEELSLHQTLRKTLLQRVSFFYVDEVDADPYTIWSRVIIPTSEYDRKIKPFHMDPSTLPPTVSDLAEMVEQAIGGNKKSRKLGTDFIMIGDIPISTELVNRYHRMVGEIRYDSVSEIICTLAEKLSLLDQREPKRKLKTTRL